MYAVMIFQTAAVLFTAFTHANISLPKRIDTTMSVVFVSPNMHKVHHHWQQPYTDSNYGLIFSFWDRMFGTYVDPASVPDCFPLGLGESISGKKLPRMFLGV